MKKVLLGLISLCFLLSGCRKGPAEPIQTEPFETEPTIQETTLPEPSDGPLLEQGTALEESGNVLYIPNETVENMIYPRLRLLGNGLLLSEYTEAGFVLKHISLENGALLAEGTVAAGPETTLYIGHEEIGLCDQESGLVTILDPSFQALRSYEITPEGEYWYLNSELDTLYIFYSDRGLLARNLESGQETWLVDNGFCVQPMGSGTAYVIFSYTDRADQKTYTRCLDLSMASLETLPVQNLISDGIRQGATWLLDSYEADGHYILVQEDGARSFDWSESAVRLLSTRRHLLVSDASCRNLTLYKTDGAFVSQCVLPLNSNAGVGGDFIWSGYWEGYFFVDILEGRCRLMFWNVNEPTEGQDLPMAPMTSAQPAEPVLEKQLYERAEALSQRFGVDIRIGEQCALTYSDYESYQLNDPVFVRTGLDILEKAFSQYPEGFLRQLTYGSIESIRVELVGSVTARDGSNELSSVGGFAQNVGAYYLVVLDGFLLRQDTVFHEFSHVINARMEWDSRIREDALYSEEGWLAHQPEGFHYANSYTEIPAELMDYIDTEYFVSNYSLTFPEEDRADLLTEAMENSSWAFAPGTGRREKLQYYADCIRDCFNTDGWPDTTSWERPLQ